MLNKEKYAKEIIEMAVNCKEIAFDKIRNKVVSCEDINCEDCKFISGSKRVFECKKYKSIWANSEYKEHKVFTEDEKTLIKLLKKVKYVARDENGALWFYPNKPIKTDISNNWFTRSFYTYASNITDLQFNAIKCEDKEPTSREEILGK